MRPDGLAGPEMIHTLLNGYGELLPEGPGLYGYVGGDPVNFFDPFGFRRVRAWNPFTWTPEVWVDAGNAALAGNAAFWDGINPFGNPFSHQYDECDRSLQWSRAVGAGTGSALSFVAPTGVGVWAAKNAGVWHGSTLLQKIAGSQAGLANIAPNKYLGGIYFGLEKTVQGLLLHNAYRESIGKGDCD